MTDFAKAPSGVLVPKNIVDGLANVVSGLGTEKGKRAHNTFEAGIAYGYGGLDAAYQTNWIARRIVDVPAGDMIREWRTIRTEKAEEIQQEEKRLGLSFVCEEALKWARLYGGAGVLMITNQDLATPLKINSIKKGDLNRLMVFDRWDLTAQEMNITDVLSPNYMLPEFYAITGGSQRIHWTHIARFDGATLPRRQKSMMQGWGDSELRKAMEDLLDTVSAKGGIAELMQEANVDVIRVDGLNEELASDEDDTIIDKFTLFSQMKSIVNLALLDKNDEYDRKTLNLSGVSPVLETLMIWLSGCANMPFTKLFGTSASGLNATGEGDLDNYYDTIRSGQKTQLDNPLSLIDEVMVRSAIGAMPDGYDYTWNPLKQADQREEAESQLMRAQKDDLLLERGVIKVSQVQKNLQAREEYQFADGSIEALEAEEESDPFDPEEPQE